MNSPETQTVTSMADEEKSNNEAPVAKQDRKRFDASRVPKARNEPQRLPKVLARAARKCLRQHYYCEKGSAQ